MKPKHEDLIATLLSDWTNDDALELAAWCETRGLTHAANKLRAATVCLPPMVAE